MRAGNIGFGFCLALASLVIGSLASMPVQAQPRVSICTIVAPSTSQDVTAFGVCRRITNNTGKNLCALTGTNDLWTKFRGRVEGGQVANVSMAACPSLDCTAPWGATVLNGNNVTAYSTNSHANCASVSELRVCTNGVLSGTFTHQTCGAPVVNGVCSSSVGGACTAGTVAGDNGQTACGTTRIWSCNGSGGGTNASCSLTNGACPPVVGISYGWGSNWWGVLGNGTNTDSSTPTPVTLPAGVTSFTSLAGGGGHGCGIGNNGRAYCWGQNGAGQLGDGTDTNRTTPTQVILPAGVTSFTSIAAGWAHTCGIGNNGRAYCWGGGYTIGNGTWSHSTTPTQVTLPAGVTSFTSIAANYYHSCGIGNNGRAYCWGTNWYGQLGDGTTTDRNTPTPVPLPDGVTSFTSITAGWEHSCGIGNNGRAYCWGFNEWGQLGDGTTTNRATPTLVPLPAGVTSFTFVGAGSHHNCGFGNDGRAYCWGNNGDGQLGDGTITSRATPTLVTLPAGVTSFTSISAWGGFHTCGIGNNGRAYCWGGNWWTQLGNGTTTGSLTPTLVSLPAGVT
ncbi:MAG: RCC1 domain-containing protein, partial [Alphaproteobacteria bacterium]